MPLTIAQDKHNAGDSPDTTDIVFVLDGDLDLLSAPDLAASVADTIVAGDRDVILDIQNLKFCDSAGLAAFVRVQNTLQERNGTIVLAGAVGTVRRILDVSGLDTVFLLVDTVDEALAAVTARRG